MARLSTFDFEGNAHGATVTPANSGFTTVGGTATAPTYTTSTPVEGLVGVQITTGATSQSQILQVSSVTLGVRTTLGMAFYVRLPAVGTQFFIGNINSGGTARASLRINADGKVAVRNNATAVHTSTFALAAATGYRIEWLVTPTGQQFKVFAGHGTTPLYDSGVVTYDMGSFDTFQCALPIAAANVNYALGWVALDDATFPGPAVTAPPNVAPTCSAGTDQVDVEPYTEVTLSGTDSDSDGTIASRLWTQLTGTPVTLTDADTATATFTAAGTIAGETPTFRYTVTDDDGATAFDDVAVQVDPVTERVMKGGVLVPCQVRTAT